MFQGFPLASWLRRLAGGSRDGSFVRWTLAASLCIAVVAGIQAGPPVPGSPAVSKIPIAAEEYTDCIPASTPLVFDGGYEVSLCYETAEGLVGEGRGGIWASGQAGLLWFFDRDNAEVLVKVLDGCSYNGRRWVYVAPVTDVAFNLHVTSPNGRRWTHRNRLGVTAVARSDNFAFVCSTDDEAIAASALPGAPLADRVAQVAEVAEAGRGRTLRPAAAGTEGVSRSPIAAGEYTDCVPTSSPLIFDGGYEVSLCYETAEGLVGEGRGGIWASGQAGLLWFFDRENAEALIKVLDGCAYNGSRWIYVAPVTDLAFNLHVTSPNGRRWTWRNRLGETASTTSDTSAFDCASDDARAGVRVTPGELTFTAAGQTARLAARVLDESGRAVEGAAVSWSSGDTAVATVDSAGLVTAVGIGRTTVTARWGSLSGEATVEVKRRPRVVVSPSGGTLAPGETLQLVAQLYDEVGNAVKGAAFTWSSSSAAVATVDSSGRVKGLALGRVTITATLRSGGADGGNERLSGTSDLNVVTAAARDRSVLVAFYRATGGASWKHSEGWLTAAPLRAWHGVETDASGRVVGLDLSGDCSIGKFTPREFRILGLTGRIPPDLGRLAGLKSLDLSCNRVSGPIPPELGRLAALESLNLSSNRLTGRIPAELGNLANLRVLTLTLGFLGSPGNRSIPPELGRLARLEELNLASTGLRGSIPPELGRLARLESLDLSVNGLSGPVPRFLGRLASLRRLDLSWNELGGLEPAVFVGLANLDFLDLSYNRGSPYTLTLRPERLDNEDLLAPGPARIKFGLTEGAPFRMVLPVSAAGGSLSAARVTVGAGSAQSPEFTVTRSSDGAGGTEVAPSAVPPQSAEFLGIRVVVEPIVLFEPTAPTVSFSTRSAAAPEGGTARLRLTLSEPAASAVTFGYRLGVDEDPATADARASDHAHEPRGTVQIAAGASTAEIRIPIVDDNRLEPPREVLTVTLDPPGEGTGYRRGHPHAATVIVEEGVCDRTPLIRDDIVNTTNVYDSRNNVDCAGVDEYRLNHLAFIQVFGSAASSRSTSGSRWTPETVARVRAGECDMESLFDDSAEAGRWAPCVEEGEQAEAVRRGGRVANANGDGVITTLREGDLAGLPNLRVLWLWDLGLTELRPDEFAGLPKLFELSLPRNDLTSLPAGIFRGLHNLQESIDLSGNRLTSLPETVFSDVSKVWLLRLDNNELTDLPPGVFSGLSRLGWLKLDRNRLTSLPPDVFRGLSALDLLALDDNELADLPPGVFSGLSRLTWLTLDGNRFAALPPGIFSDLSALEVLSLHSNQFRAVPTRALEDLPGLQSLFIWGNSLGSLEADAFSGLANLTRLSIGASELSVVAPGAFASLGRLDTLLMNGNLIEELPPGAFAGVGALQRLRLDGNPGAPFPLTLEMRRADSVDPRAPGPARLALALEQGAPINFRVPLSAHGGRVSADVATLGAGSESGRTVRATGTGRSAMQVVAGPAPELPSDFQGVHLQVGDPLVLFGSASNRSPVPEHPLPLLRLEAGSGGESVDPSSHFRDPDGDGLTYRATVNRPDVVSVRMSGNEVRVTPVGTGSATVDVTATDPGGLSARLSLPVSVRGARPGLFDIDLILQGDVPAPVRVAFDRAIAYWEAILAATDLTDVPVSGDFDLGCLGARARTSNRSVDDLVIVARVTSIDGERGVIARAAVCGVREGQRGLPFMAAIEFDADDAEWMPSRDLDEVVLHEMGHALGIGTLWSRFGLLRNPSAEVGLESVRDTHFPGPLAIRAFDQAGGAAYGHGEKVPVANVGGFGSFDSHWRNRVFNHELMTSTQHIGVADPLSAVSIQSLADLGYTVDVSLAEAYALPGAVAEDSAQSAGAEPVDTIEYGSDTPRAPIIVVDRTGRIVGPIPE